MPPIPHDANGQTDQARPTDELIFGDAVSPAWVGPLICGIIALHPAGRVDRRVLAPAAKNRTGRNVFREPQKAFKAAMIGWIIR